MQYSSRESLLQIAISVVSQMVQSLYGEPKCYGTRWITVRYRLGHSWQPRINNLFIELFVKISRRSTQYILGHTIIFSWNVTTTEMFNL